MENLFIYIVYVDIRVVLNECFMYILMVNFWDNLNLNNGSVLYK